MQKQISIEITGKNFFMLEKNKTTTLMHWLKAYKNETMAIECKICKEASLPFSAVKDHQVNALYLAKHGLMNYKIGDCGFDEKPFDLFMLARVKAFIVIFWYQKRGDNRMTWIDVDMWNEERSSSDRKSITFERACEIGVLYQL